MPEHSHKPTTAQTTGPTLITLPDQGITPIYQLLQSAKKTIDMTMYELVDTQAEQILAQQAAAGIAVRVILDQNGEKSANTPAFTYLAANGVKVVFANKIYAVTHQKTITIDGATSAIMTANLTSIYYAGTRDFALIEANPADIAAIETTFAADFAAATVTPPAGADLVWSPTTAKTLLLQVINSAMSTLAVENEEMSDAAIVSALEVAAKRGVAVQITMSANSAYAKEFTALTAAGAQVHLYAQSASLYIHAKIIVADAAGATPQAYLGSINFSVNSLTRNRELGIILSDPSVIASLQATLAADFAGGTPWAAVTPAFLSGPVRRPS